MDQLELRTLTNKAITFVKQFPCRPGGSFGSAESVLTSQQAWKVHRYLIEEYNEFVDRLRLDNSDKKYGKLIKLKVIQ